MSKADLIPFAVQSKARMKERGTYKNGYPQGAIVHFTAGRDGAQKTITGGIKNGFTFLCIQKDGVLVQAHRVSKYGYHAGVSAWGDMARAALKKAGLGKFFKPLSGSVSDDLIGFEINCAGGLKKQSDGSYQSWFKTTIPKENVRYSEGKDNQAKGYYEKFTKEQEATLVKSLLWLKSQAPDIFDFDLVLGHDEVAGPKGIGKWRKTDPGASLSMTMTEFRAHLKAEYEKTKSI